MDQKKRNKQAGFALSSELLLTITLLGLGMIVGLATIRNSTLAELEDFAEGAFPNSGSKKRNVIVINPPKRRVYSTVIKQQSKTHEWRFGRPNLL